MKHVRISSESARILGHSSNYGSARVGAQRRNANIARHTEELPESMFSPSLALLFALTYHRLRKQQISTYDPFTQDQKPIADMVRTATKVQGVSVIAGLGLSVGTMVLLPSLLTITGWSLLVVLALSAAIASVFSFLLAEAVPFCASTIDDSVCSFDDITYLAFGRAGKIIHVFFGLIQLISTASVLVLIQSHVALSAFAQDSTHLAMIVSLSVGGFLAFTLCLLPVDSSSVVHSLGIFLIVLVCGLSCGIGAVASSKDCPSLDVHFMHLHYLAFSFSIGILSLSSFIMPIQTLSRVMSPPSFAVSHRIGFLLLLLLFCAVAVMGVKLLGACTEPIITISATQAGIRVSGWNISRFLSGTLAIAVLPLVTVYLQPVSGFIASLTKPNRSTQPSGQSVWIVSALFAQTITALFAYLVHHPLRAAGLAGCAAILSNLLFPLAVCAKIRWEALGNFTRATLLISCAVFLAMIADTLYVTVWDELSVDL